MSSVPPLPKLYLERMQWMLGERYTDFEQVYTQPPLNGIRFNLLKVSQAGIAEILKRMDIVPQPIPWVDEGYLVPEDTRVGKHVYHAAGLYYIQEPSAMAVGQLLDPQPGEFILDLAAAPGGKTTHIASHMRNQGFLLTNDIHPRRVYDLAKNVERWGATNLAITQETPERLAAHFGPIFDRVLVDAPCSGEGMFRKEPAARYEWTPKFVESCASRQDDILHSASALVRSGGMLVYATCTFAPEEDEGTVVRFLNAHPEFELVDAPHYAGFSHGREEWLGDSFSSSGVERCVRIMPHEAPGEGHFIALMQKRKDADGHILPRRQMLERQTIPAEFEVFCEQVGINRDRFAGKYITRRGDYLYAVPQDALELSGLRVIRWGWFLGVLKKNRFEPSHAFALAIKGDDVVQVVHLSSEQEEVKQYMQRSGFVHEGEGGWVLVCVDGYSLGWGKRVGNVVKSHLPKYWRWM